MRDHAVLASGKAAGRGRSASPACLAQPCSLLCACPVPLFNGFVPIFLACFLLPWLGVSPPAAMRLPLNRLNVLV